MSLYRGRSSSIFEVSCAAHTLQDFPWHNWLPCHSENITAENIHERFIIHQFSQGDTFANLCLDYQNKCRGIIVVNNSDELSLPPLFWPKPSENLHNVIPFISIIIVRLSDARHFESDKNIHAKVSAAVPSNLNLARIRFLKVTEAGMQGFLLD